MVIRQMKPEHATAWFDFFDNRAFADHEEWQGCYCTGPFSPRMKQYTRPRVEEGETTQSGSSKRG